MTDQADDAAALDALLEFVKESRGFDFTGYKRSSLQRRVAKRMSAVDVQRYEDYVDYLQLHRDEFAQLFNTLLINVTGFFRDPDAWEYLAADLLPQLVASRPPACLPAADLVGRLRLGRGGVHRGDGVRSHPRR